MRYLGAGLIASLTLASPVLAADAAAGKTLYGKMCTSCHGQDGKGNGPAAAKLKTRPRDHTDCAAMKALTDEYLKTIIEKGGQGVGKSSDMPPWGKAVSAAQMEDLVAYVRSFCAKK